MVYNIPKLGAQENLHREDTAALQLQYITWDMEMHLQIPFLNREISSWISSRLWWC